MRLDGAFQRTVVMNFLILPPEINSARMYLGAGPGPMLEAATAWEGLAGELGSAAGSFGSVTSGLADAAWQGPAAVAMAGAAAPYVGWLSAAAAQRSEEHTSELQSRGHLVCRLLL